MERMKTYAENKSSWRGKKLLKRIRTYEEDKNL